MSDAMYPSATREAAQKRRELSPATEEAFQAFSQKVFAEGALSIKMKQLIAVAVAHVTQCPYCIKGHTKAALRHGASREELMEAIWVAAEMRAEAPTLIQFWRYRKWTRFPKEKACERSQFDALEAPLLSRSSCDHVKSWRGSCRR